MSPRAAPPLWLAVPSRFAGLSPRTAWWVAAALVLLLIASLTALIGTAPEATPDGARQVTDLILYESIIDGLRAGGEYYRLASDALRVGGYPLRPFVAVRLPVHSVVQAALPLAASLSLLWLLGIAVALAWWAKLRDVLVRPAPRFAVAILFAGGMTAFVQVDLIAFHEIWAALLVALALGLRTPERWLAPVAIALVAMLVRETAALFALVMALLAFAEGHRREGTAWLAALLVFALVLAAHAWAVAQVTGPLDPASPGWAGMLGFGFFARALVTATALTVLPLAIAAPLIGLALVGWAAWRDPTGLRAIATFAAYALALALFARPDTFYWGLMVAPVFLIGLVFVPDALRDLARSLRPRRRVRVQRVTP